MLLLWLFTCSFVFLNVTWQEWQAVFALEWCSLFWFALVFIFIYLFLIFCSYCRQLLKFLNRQALFIEFVQFEWVYSKPDCLKCSSMAFHGLFCVGQKSHSGNILLIRRVQLEAVDGIACSFSLKTLLWTLICLDAFYY